MQYEQYAGQRYADTPMEGGGFFAALFDLSFSKFVTTRIVTILYVLAILVAFFAAVFGVFTAFSTGLLQGIIGLVFAPVALVVYITIVRIWLEFVIVVFRIADHARQIADNTGGTVES